jgi:hypothetical protein
MTKNEMLAIIEPVVNDVVTALKQHGKRVGAPKLDVLTHKQLRSCLSWAEDIRDKELKAYKDQRSHAPESYWTIALSSRDYEDFHEVIFLRAKNKQLAASWAERPMCLKVKA